MGQEKNYLLSSVSSWAEKIEELQVTLKLLDKKIESYEEHVLPYERKLFDTK